VSASRESLNEPRACLVAFAHTVPCPVPEIMPPATLHGVGVIIKVYAVIFAVFSESMTLNLAQRPFKVIHFGGNRKPFY